jgi:hypothetical protein
LCFFNKNSIALTDTGHIKADILKYIDSIEEFSAKFIQTNGLTIEEGKLFLKNKRIKIQYEIPSKIDIIIAKNKAMYFNRDLQEVEYFNPKNSIANHFYMIFFNKTFFDNAKFQEKNGYVYIEKETSLNNELIKVEIFIEQKPINIRKLQVTNSETTLTFSIMDTDLNPNIDNKFFSMINPI